MGSGTNQEKHDPNVGTEVPQTPLPDPHPPSTRERHGPPPHSNNPRRHSLPLPTGRHTRWGTPWARHSPPSQRSPVWRLSHGQHKPSHHQETAPTQGRNGSIGQALRKERYPRTLGEKTTQSWLVSSQSATGQRPPEQRCREGWKHPLPGMLQRSPPSLGREMAQD